MLFQDNVFAFLKSLKFHLFSGCFYLQIVKIKKNKFLFWTVFITLPLTRAPKIVLFTRIFVNQKIFFQYSALVIRISVTWFLWKSCKFECLHKGILLSQKHKNVAVCSFWRKYPMWLWMVPWNYVVLQLETPGMCVGNDVAHWMNHLVRWMLYVEEGSLTPTI